MAYSRDFKSTKDDKTTATVNKTVRKENTPAPAEKWTNITGECRVFANKVESKKGNFYRYSTSVGSKDPVTEEWANCFIDVKFKRDEDPVSVCGCDACRINIFSGFLTCDSYKDRNGNEVTKLVLVVTDYEVIDE